MKKKRLKIAAVLLAAGKSTRFGNKVPKQYIKINHKPLLVYTLQTIADSDLFDEIVVVVNKKHQALKQEAHAIFGANNKRNIHYIVGGSNRSQSTYNAIKFLKGKGVDFILFHDVVRPFIAQDLIKKIVRGAIKYDAVVAGTQTLESSAFVVGGKVIQTLSREGLCNLQTPECYRFALIEKAYDVFHTDKKFFAEATNLHLVFALKKDVHVIMHTGRNLKVTLPEDFLIAQSLMGRRV